MMIYIVIFNHYLFLNGCAVIVANRLANSGKEWVDKFFTFNDGTYNNEWMITDFKQFTPGTPPKSG